MSITNYVEVTGTPERIAEFHKTVIFSDALMGLKIYNVFQFENVDADPLSKVIVEFESFTEQSEIFVSISKEYEVQTIHSFYSTDFIIGSVVSYCGYKVQYSKFKFHPEALKKMYHLNLLENLPIPIRIVNPIRLEID